MRGALAASVVSPAWRLLLLSDGSVTRHLQIVSGKLPNCLVAASHAETHPWPSPVLRIIPPPQMLRADNETEVEVIRQDVGVVVVAGAAAAEPFPLPKECALLVPPLLQRQACPQAFHACFATPARAADIFHDAVARVVAAQVWLRAKPDGGSSNVPSLSSPAPPLVYACSWWHEEAFRASMRAEGAPIWRNLAAARTEAFRDLCDVYLGDNAALEAAFGTQGPFWGRHYVLYAGGKPLTVVYEVFGPSLATWLGDRDGRAVAAASS